jgi:hypothetical protein
VLLKKKILELADGEYYIGFLDKDDIKTCPLWYDKVKWIKTNGFEKDGWFADPFILEVTDDKIILLAEQFYYPINRGRIVQLTLDKSYKLLNVKPILTLSTHLSFPNIWRENGKTYVYPENYQGGALRIYEYKEQGLVNPRTIINEPLLDSQMIKINDKYFVFAVKYVKQVNGQILSILIFGKVMIYLDPISIYRELIINIIIKEEPVK